MKRKFLNRNLPYLLEEFWADNLAQFTMLATKENYFCLAS